MSYCRFSPTSDVYLYIAELDGEITWVCCSCMFLTEEHPNMLLSSPAQTLAHLERHKEAKHKVPKAAFERLRMEIERGR